MKTANTTLVDQVMNLQRQLDDMHRTSQIFIKKNDMHASKEANANDNNNNRKMTGNESNRSHTSTHSRESEDLP